MDDTRRVPEPARPDDPRSPFRRDRDRVLYSPHFARLAEITQVVSPDRGYVFHNRLTHSIKVAQVARTIGEMFLSKHPAECRALGGIDPDAAEAAGLAHDLGHPPFGHIAEEALDELVRGAGVSDGFEGNAQSFRLVCRLTVGDAWTSDDNEVGAPVAGLNLTRSSLGGIVKYPWSHGGNPDKPRKWGFYQDEADYFQWVRGGTAGQVRTLIAEVMDWADDVTYAIHDLLDFYKAGLIPLELVRKNESASNSVERESFLDRMFEHKPAWRPRQSAYEAALDGVLDSLPFDASHRYSATEVDDQLLYQFATTLISRFVNAVLPTPGSATPVDIQRDARDQVDVLKEFIWAYVILNPDMAVLQSGQRRAIRGVFEESLAAARAGVVHFFPGAFRGRLTACANDAGAVRLAADYVAGMTERELIRTYRRLYGMRE